jgi:hypothetical protein
MLGWIERWAVRRARRRLTERIGTLRADELLEAMGRGEEDPMFRGVMVYLAGQQELVAEQMADRRQTDSDRAWRCGKLAALLDAQEDLAKLREDGERRRAT